MRQQLPLRQAIALGLIQGPTELLPVSSSGHTTLIPWLARWDGYGELAPELRKSLEVALHAGAAAALLLDLRLAPRNGRPARRRRSGGGPINFDGAARARVRARPRVRARTAPSFFSISTPSTPPGRLALPPRAGLITLSFLPPALAGYVFESRIERRLGTPATIAGGLIAGSIGMAVADRRGGGSGGRAAAGGGASAAGGRATARLGGSRSGAAADGGARRGGGGARDGGRSGAAADGGTRSLAEAGLLDGLLLGCAQLLALAPGVSRNGATLAVARLRGFSRADSATLSWEIALPVVVGASALKGARACQGGIPAGSATALGGGALASFLTTLISARLLGARRARPGSLLPYAVYRVLLALLVIARLRQTPRAANQSIN
jgi:undecaprenyl-diphosphatase